MTGGAIIPPSVTSGKLLKGSSHSQKREQSKLNLVYPEAETVKTTAKVQEQPQRKLADKMDDKCKTSQGLFDSVSVSVPAFPRPRRMCDSCVTDPATLYCAADDAYICDVCDGFVHGANPLSQRHERVRLGPNGAPVKIFRRAGGNGNPELPAMVRGSGVTGMVRSSSPVDRKTSAIPSNVTGPGSSRPAGQIEEKVSFNGTKTASGDMKKRHQHGSGVAKARIGVTAKQEPQAHSWEPNFPSHCVANGQRSSPVAASASASALRGASDASRASPFGVSTAPPPPHCYWRPDGCSPQGVPHIPPYAAGVLPPYMPPPHMSPYGHPWVAPPPMPGVVYPPGPWGPVYGPHMGMPYMGAPHNEYMGHPRDYAAVPNHPCLAESMRSSRASKKQKRSGVLGAPMGAAGVAESATRNVKQEVGGSIRGKATAEGMEDEAFLDILSFDDVDRFFVDEADECTAVLDGKTGREVPDVPQLPDDHAQPGRALKATDPASLSTTSDVKNLDDASACLPPLKPDGQVADNPSSSRASSSSGCGEALHTAGVGECEEGLGEVKPEQGFEDFIISHGEEEGETDGWFVRGWGLDESAEAESEVVEAMEADARERRAFGTPEGSPTVEDASGDSSASAAGMKAHQSHLGKRPRAEVDFGHDVSPAAGGADGRTFTDGDLVVKLGSRKEMQQQSPSLRLNYEDVISAWSGQAHEGQSPWIQHEHEYEEGSGEGKRAGNVHPLPTYSAVLASHSSPSLPWATQDTTKASPSQQWAQQQQEQRRAHEQQSQVLQPAIDNDSFDQLAGEGREARVLRYREKRRTRLFSKKIRYEVRKVNADQRPRVKGRFVKRTQLPTQV